MRIVNVRRNLFILNAFFTSIHKEISRKTKSFFFSVDVSGWFFHVKNSGIGAMIFLFKFFSKSRSIYK